MTDNTGSMREAVYRYVKRKYKTAPEFLWMKFPDYAVFRHDDNNKWYGLIMNIPRSKLSLPGDEYTDILNVKMDDPLLRDLFIRQEGCFPGYHISSGNWISVLLDGTVPLKDICGMIDISYRATASKKTKDRLRPAKEWLVPANPKYYDIEHAFDNASVIDWKQSGSAKAGDIIYMYAAAPISAIIYKCKVEEADIPYNYKDEKLTISRLMRIKLLRRYAPDKFTFDVLKNDYGIFAVRGPRGIPDSLSRKLRQR